MSSGDAGQEPTPIFVLYHYVPSLPAALIFTAILGLSSAAHTWQIVRTKTWYFIPMLIGVLMEAIGYVGRIMSHYDNMALGPYIMQTLLILIAPALIAASIYMILGRLIVMVEGEEYSLVRIKWLTKTFVLGDVVSFLMQSAGGGLMAANYEMMHTGERIIIVGLIVQLLWFGFFIVTSFVFHIRIARSPTSASLRHQAPVSWKTMLYVLYAASLLIMIRSIFRLVEYIQGNGGYLLRHEAYLYIFDAVLMSIAVILFNVFHPSKVLVTQPDHKGYTSSTSSNVETYQMVQGV
ncbi:envelope glycoprotein [Paramarasmius palmivorus]|uniref:Envelope glycoprotein n=1 Tax=Paramarasmius palmivorus TaxID=297713 RepID=A0AAW0DNC3_9AGAR